MLNVCPYCEVGALEEVTYSDRMKAGRKTFKVDGLTKLVCIDCGSESVPLEMYSKNAATLERMASSSRAAVSRGMLRKLREVWGVTQREASRIFGAGESAFAKWESGQSELSTPSALLVQCAVKFPAVMAHLADLARVDLKMVPVLSASWESNTEWHSVYRAFKRGAPRDSGARLYVLETASPSHAPRAAKGVVRSIPWSDGLHFSAANGTYFSLPEAA